MAFKMKGMEYGEGTGSAFPNVGKTGEYSKSAAFQYDKFEMLMPHNVDKKLNKKNTKSTKTTKSKSTKTTKSNVYKPPPVQTISRKEYIPQSQRKSANTGVSYKQAWTKNKDNVQSKYKDEASFTKAAKEWNKKNTKKEYTPNRNYNYKPQSLK